MSFTSRCDELLRCDELSLNILLALAHRTRSACGALAGYVPSTCQLARWSTARALPRKTAYAVKAIKDKMEDEA